MKSNRSKIIRIALLGLFSAIMVVALTAAGGNFARQLNPFLTDLDRDLQAHEAYHPEDRVYLQFDKPFYKPGEDIWFSAYLRDGRTMQASKRSEILHVELINPKGNVQQKMNLVALNGFSKGDFHLDAELPGGMYKVKAYSLWQQNAKDPFFFEKEVQVQKVVLPNLKMKLEFEKKAYGPGDYVTAELDLQTNANQELKNHAFSYVASLDGTTLEQLQGTTDAHGKARLRVKLPAELETTDGLVNVMIQYQGLTESISRSIPITLNKIDLQFYPEGGDLVGSLPGKVAFRALNEYGKPADIEGVILDENGTTVAGFASYHHGMGAFQFTPEPEKAYTARITKPAGIDQEYTLPEALPRGFVLEVNQPNSKALVAHIHSTETEDLNLVAQVRGQIYWSSEVPVKKGRTEVEIPLSEFPMGVCQLTLFDSKGIERAERLSFVNRDRQLQVSVDTDKEKYLPREKVKMTVRVRDERGMPMPARLSLAVVNDQLLSFADDKSGHILSQLLLEPDLNQKVEEPRFYFDPEEEKSLMAMDYLLMTSGWRRFTWEEIRSDRLPTLKNNGEKAVVSGVILDAYTGKPIPHASIASPDLNFGMLTDKDGKFEISRMDLTKGNQLEASHTGLTSQLQTVVAYNQPLTFYLYPEQNRPMGGGNVLMEVDEVWDAEIVEENLVVNDIVMVKERRGAAPRMKKAEAGEGKVNAVMQWQFAGNAANAADAPQAAVAEVMPIEGIEREEPRDHEEKDKGRRDNGLIAMEDQKAADGDLDAFDMGNIGDQRMARLLIADTIAMNGMAQGVVYHRAREFAAPVYEGTKGSQPKERTDFRSTLYWNPEIEVDRSGKAVLEFYASDEITSFRTIVEGIAQDGSVGRAEDVFYTQLPFSMAVRVPTEVAAKDRLSVPVTLTNNTLLPLSGSLHVLAPASLKPLSSTGSAIMIPAGSSKTINLEYDVLHAPGEGLLEVAFAGAGHTDAFKQPITVVAAGFPVNIAYSGKQSSASHKFKMSNVVDGSVTAQFTAFPSVVSDLVKGIESILREPYGCFEQTSTSSYPNALVLSYLEEQEDADPALMERARDLLDKGYRRLTTFETSQNGYEWFGSNPPHEALTAYGLMQFNDYQQVYDGVDSKMVDRTAKWLMARRDGKGGFKRDGKALDSFGRADDDITNAYIVYALSEAGYDEIMLEADKAFEQAMASKDAYQLALMANAMFNLKQNAKADQALQALMQLQEGDGSFTSKKHSITRSTGISLKVETTSLAVLAMIKSDKTNEAKLQKAVQSIVSSRSGHGGFGSTQGTILALKSLVAYSKHSKKTDEAGLIEIHIDGRKVAEQAYEAGRKEPVEIKGLEAYLNEGVHTIEVKYVGVENPLPYALGIDYHTDLPPSSKECVIDLETRIASQRVKMGETVRLSATLRNKTEEGQPMTMAILGLPAGLSAQPWQLKEMQEKQVIDFYEIVGNNVVCYYRQMKPGEVREINLDLKADIPGTYTAPASSAYLYYTAEHKVWKALPTVTVSN